MGFDVSFHPVDLAFIVERIVPCLLGRAPLQPLVDDAIVRERVRFRAKAWALAAYQASREEERDPPRIDPFVHLWGRPFFIVASTPDEVSDQIDAYRAATTVDEVDRLARDNLRRVELPAVAPSLRDGMPDHATLEATVAERIRVLVGAIAAVHAGAAQYHLPGGDRVDPAKLVVRDYPLIALTFAARFRPGWMDRGHTWPTYFMDAAELDTEPYFEPPESLFPDALVAKVGSPWQASIDENYMVGGFVPAPAVPGLRSLLRREQAALLAPARREDWEDGARRALSKLDEALAYAERHHLAFAEATELYSAPFGILN